MKLIKLIKLISSIVLVLFMTLLTAIGYSPDLGLTGGSLDSIQVKIKMPVVFPTVILLVFLILLYFYFKRKIKLGFLVPILLLWILSGRMVGILPYGQVSIGWFYIPTDEFSLCVDPNADCEAIMVQQTKTERLFFWRIRIKNKNIDKIVFIGPFLWSNALKVFNETFIPNKT